jgi:hypothetical protein
MSSTKTPARLVEPEAAPTASDLDRIRAMDTAALRAELADAIGHTAKHLLRLALIWAELERRGEDLSDLRSGLGTYLPLIASGAVLPDVVVRFAGNNSLLRAVASLPVGEQRRLADGEPVLLAVRQGDTITHRMLPAHALTAVQVRQVFGDRRVRTETEQIAILSAQPAPAKPGRPPKRGRVRADPERNVVLLGRRVLNPADLVVALADLRRPDTADPGELEAVVAVKLTEDERRRLNHAAVDANKTQQALVRDTLRAAGLI